MFVEFPQIAALLDALPFVVDDSYCAEEMLDGQRLLISKHGGVVHAFSRDRIEHFLPILVLELARSFAGDFVLDGQLLGECFIAFDLLEGCRVNVCGEPYALRRRLLARISPFPIAALATSETGKAFLIGSVREAGGVGIMFKRLDVAYDSGHDTHGIWFDHSRTGSPRPKSRVIERGKGCESASSGVWH